MFVFFALIFILALSHSSSDNSPWLSQTDYIPDKVVSIDCEMVRQKATGSLVAAVVGIVNFAGKTLYEVFALTLKSPPALAV